MIVFDIGNTDTVIGFFEKNELKTSFRIRSLKNENAFFFEYRILNFFLEQNISSHLIIKAVISSVVPELTEIFKAFVVKFLHLTPLIVSPSKSNLLTISIDKPEELGSDLFINSLAANYMFDTGCVVVDFGTALTFTTVTKNKEILGVIILPGIKTAINSLVSGTSLLPQVKLEKPTTVIGKNSVHAIQSGIIYGYEHLTKGIIAQIKTEVPENLYIIATGGLSSVFKDSFDIFDSVDQNLTLKGLNLYGQYQE